MLLKVKNNMIKDFVRCFVKRYFYHSASRIYLDMYKRIDKANVNILLTNIKWGVEEEWLNKWRKYDKKLKPDCFRVFSNYIGASLDIMPLEFIASFVEPILNPKNYLNYYSDKNNFGLILSGVNMPTIYLRNIGGYLLSEDYKIIDRERGEQIICALVKNIERVIVKPTQLASGRGVQMFFSDGIVLKNREGEVLSVEYLIKEYGRDWMIQQCVVQSAFCAQFNLTSVNTIRIATYRDVNGKVHVVSAGFRIGRKGSVIDNAHGGGLFCGVDRNGTLSKYVCDTLGRKQTVFNDVDFENNTFVIPNWDSICDFTLSVAERIVHHDLVAFDIALDKGNNPLLIEFNVGGFGSWFFLMGGNTVFGEFTDEVAERCFNAYQKLEYYIYSPVCRSNTLTRL